MATKKTGKRRGRPPKTPTFDDLEREGLSRDDLEQLALEEEVAVDEESDLATEAVMRDLGLNPFGELE
jgi:hypothetical protein